MKFMILSSCSDILLKNHNFIYSVDKAFQVIKVMDLNWTGPHILQYYFNMPVLANKMEVFYSTTPYIHLRLDSRIEPSFLIGESLCNEYYACPGKQYGYVK